ncbi:uncharacterized protein LOC143183647 [Calliopsis andreniformis]|uniref:uncharacterized protein LOC143183647 n=1 Tax=Calliopsis andreniformis TaxID=337506 RepID=UPI003FCC64AF
MLEPLIVLTVLNCFFMFSSTVTTCALWWQYRSHRCCFKRDSTSQAVRHGLSKLRSNYSPKNPKKLENPKLDNPSGIDRSKSNSTVNRNSKNRRSSKQKKSTNVKYLDQDKLLIDRRASSTETMAQRDFEDRTRMSEASQTGYEPKSAVVMEYSTVQKIVQILDNDTDMTATKLAIKDLNAKEYVEDKKADSGTEAKFEGPTLTVYTPVSQT